MRSVKERFHGVFAECERTNAYGGRSGRHAPAVGAARRAQDEGDQVRLWRRPVRRLHGPVERDRDACLPDQRLDRWHPAGHHHRRAPRRCLAPAAAGLARARRAAVRLLPGGSVDGRLGAPRPQPRADRCRHRYGDERQCLPVRHLSAHPRSDSPGGARRTEGVAMKDSMTLPLDRRSFLKVTALAGGGVAIGLYAPSFAQGPGGGAAAWSLAARDYITVHPDNTFSIIAKNPETGQGIRHALPQLIADEFDVDWSQVKIVQADLNPKYGPQSEGGSRATPVNYDPMRQVGAGGRLMMVTAAGQLWNVPAGELTTGRGAVTHAASKRTATYASLAERVAAMAPPAADAVRAAYKNPANFGIIGKPIKGVDNVAIVTGKPAFSLDIEPEGTLCAVFEKCPVFGGTAVSANLDEIKRLPGIRHAFLVEAISAGNNGLASGVFIVGDHFWLANNARRTLKVVWDEGPVATQSTAGYTAMAKRLAAERASAPPPPPPQGGRGGGGGGAAIGDVEAAFKSAAKVIEAE